MSRPRIIEDRSGVTLMEMMIIVVLIGLLAAMAVPQWIAAMPRIRARATMRDVVSSLRMARSLAISRKEPFGVNFNQTTGQYTLFADRNSPDLHSFTTGDSIVAAVPVGMDVSIATATLPNGNVVFQPDGSASATGNVIFTTHESPLATTFSVDILASTGRVRLTEVAPTG